MTLSRDELQVLVAQARQAEELADRRRRDAALSRARSQVAPLLDDLRNVLRAAATRGEQSLVWSDQRLDQITPDQLQAISEHLPGVSVQTMVTRNRRVDLLFSWR